MSSGTLATGGDWELVQNHCIVVLLDTLAAVAIITPQSNESDTIDPVKQAGYGGSDARRERFARDGCLSPVRVPDAAAHRERMERAEAVTSRRKHPSP